MTNRGPNRLLRRRWRSLDSSLSRPCSGGQEGLKDDPTPRRFAIMLSCSGRISQAQLEPCGDTSGPWWWICRLVSPYTWGTAGWRMTSPARSRNKRTTRSRPTNRTTLAACGKCQSGPLALWHHIGPLRPRSFFITRGFRMVDVYILFIVAHFNSSPLACSHVSHAWDHHRDPHSTDFLVGKIQTPRR